MEHGPEIAADPPASPATPKPPASPIRPASQPPVDQSLHDQYFNITMEIVEPEPVVERNVTISSIILSYIKKVKTRKHIYVQTSSLIN